MTWKQSFAEQAVKHWAEHDWCQTDDAVVVVEPLGRLRFLVIFCYRWAIYINSLM